MSCHVKVCLHSCSAHARMRSHAIHSTSSSSKSSSKSVEDESGRSTWAWAVWLWAQEGVPTPDGQRMAYHTLRVCKGPVARLTIEEIGVHLLARGVVAFQEGKIVFVYVHVCGKSSNERLT